MKFKPLSILLVDDENPIITKLKLFFENSDYHADLACSGMEAIKKINKTNYDIVVSDIEMPEMDGLELLKRIRKTVDYSLPIILMTDSMDVEYAINAVRLGASDFVKKPVDMKQLLKSVNNLVTVNKATQQIQNMSQQLLCADMEFQFHPEHFLETDISTALTVLFKQYFELQPYLVNEITLCLEEMLNNALVHGTLKLDEQIRQMDYLNYLAHLKKMISDQEIASKKIILQAKLNKREKYLQLVVTDEGKGFDYQHWLKLTQDEIQKNLTYHGRGIALIKLIADELQFQNEGRTIMIRKHLEHTERESSAIQ
jgi:DNA-binding response OmpR family regulator